MQAEVGAAQEAKEAAAARAAAFEEQLSSVQQVGNLPHYRRMSICLFPASFENVSAFLLNVLRLCKGIAEVGPGVGGTGSHQEQRAGPSGPSQAGQPSHSRNISNSPPILTHLLLARHEQLQSTHQSKHLRDPTITCTIAAVMTVTLDAAAVLGLLGAAGSVRGGRGRLRSTPAGLRRSPGAQRSAGRGVRRPRGRP